MKKLIFILAVLWLGLSAFANSVKADTNAQILNRNDPCIITTHAKYIR